MNTLLRLERCLLPAPETVHWNGGQVTIESSTTAEKVGYYAKNFFAFAGLLCVSPLTLAYDWLTHKPVRPMPLERREALSNWLPEQRGYAMSFFQLSGLGTRWGAPQLEGRSDWDQWMTKPSHVAHPDGFIPLVMQKSAFGPRESAANRSSGEGVVLPHTTPSPDDRFPAALTQAEKPILDHERYNYRNFFTDVLSNPDPYIRMLKEHGVTAHRFSLEWSVIQPKPGEISLSAVQLYHTFIQKLIANGITPSVTLSHFVVPDWFHERGGFKNIDNVEAYVAFALQIMTLFPEVKDWWSFNEPGVRAFQQVREVFPTEVPEGSPLSERVYAAGLSMRNMLIAHCKLHQEVARRWPEKKLGITHQWLKFDTASGNCVERLFRYFLEKFGFRPVVGFFQSGEFAFEFPFMANVHFKIPEADFQANDHFLMRLGVQAYPLARLTIRCNQGRLLPIAPGSFQNSVITCGSTCEPGGVLMRFGPRQRQGAMREILDEAFALTRHIVVSEYGSDGVNWADGQPGFALDTAAQAKHIKQLTEEMRQYSLTTGRLLEGIFCWSDVRNMEWNEGNECRLWTIEPKIDYTTRQMIGYEDTEASKYLASIFSEGAPNESSDRSSGRGGAESKTVPTSDPR